MKDSIEEILKMTSLLAYFNDNLAIEIEED